MTCNLTVDKPETGSVKLWRLWSQVIQIYELFAYSKCNWASPTLLIKRSSLHVDDYHHVLKNWKKCFKL